MSLLPRYKDKDSETTIPLSGAEIASDQYGSGGGWSNSKSVLFPIEVEQRTLKNR